MPMSKIRVSNLILFSSETRGRLIGFENQSDEVMGRELSGEVD